MTLKEKLGLDKDPLFLMDGTAFIYRGFYANRHLQRSDGYPTNALVVVTRVLLRILRQETPRHFLFAMDGPGKNFRSAIYGEYKANREAMPEDLAKQIDPVKRMVDALGLRREIADGVEADDCIASLANRFSARLPVVIVSGDKDLKQCLRENVFMWDPASKEEKLLTKAEFTRESGVAPEQWPDVQALIGDSSDNIPGVPGIGPKTARQIFDTCHTLEEIRNNLDSLPPKIQDKLRDHLDIMFKWRDLTTLRLDACPNLVLEDLAVGEINVAECGKLADEFELSAVRREIAALAQAGRGPLETSPDRSGKEQIIPLPLAAAPETASADSLPDCSGKTVAVIWPEGPGKPPRIAAEQSATEYAWTGTMADLCAWLANAGKMVVADLKTPLVKMPSWQKLFLDSSQPRRPQYFDLGLASYLLNPEEGDYSWPRLAARWREPLKCESGPALLALAMAGALEKNLAANGMTSLYEEMELPLVPVLAEMEIRGIAIDPANFRGFLDEVELELGRLEQQVYAEAGTTFNIRSSQQLGEVLFERLHLASGRKTKGGQPSTSQLALEKLAPQNPVVESVLQFRKLDKMRSTYLDPLPRLMDANGRLHTTFNQEATATGRLSSSNPNLQNIPVRGELGQRMRACFIARRDHLLIAADYSQIELRLLAHFSGDETLLRAFQEGEDIHARTASLVFDLPQNQVSPDQRRMAKTINFGLLYGMGAQKLAQELKIGVSQAKEFIERYFSRLSGVKQFYEKVLQSARDLGYVTTMAGRRRWLPGIFSANGQISAQAQRQAINAVIQGSAADIIKIAMLAVAHDQELLEKNARIVMQVHDELLLEAPQDCAEQIAPRVAGLMEAACPAGSRISVPMRVDWGVGPNWGAAH